MGTHPIFESDFDCLTVKSAEKMTRYSAEVESSARSCKTSGSDVRVHFKNTRETAQAIKGMHLHKAVSYLKAVIAHERCIPFKRFCGGVGRTGQAKAFKSTTSQGRWPRNLASTFSVSSRTPSLTLRSKDSMLMPLSSITSRSTLLPNSAAEPTVLTVALTLTWLLPVT